MKMRRFMKRFRYGEKGFTLIELLVVVAILGVLAAVVIPNVAKFIGSGKVEAANTEMADVQLAVVAYMADNSLATWPATGTATIGPTDTGDGPWEFLLNVASLQGIYTIEDSGIISAVLISGDPPSKWTGLHFDTSTRTWVLDT